MEVSQCRSCSTFSQCKSSGVFTHPAGVLLREDVPLHRLVLNDRTKKVADIMDLFCLKLEMHESREQALDKFRQYSRLVLPVVRGHAKAATKVGVTLLTAPFQEGKAFDFKGLGEIAGTTVVPRQPGEADYNPPRTFAADLTRAVKQIAAGEATFRGFVVRVVPERGVDEGYITRIDLPRAARPQLELEVYDRK